MTGLATVAGLIPMVIPSRWKWLCCKFDGIMATNSLRASKLSVASPCAGYEGVYSLGRVQTPTLALIVERDHEITIFVPTTYFEEAPHTRPSKR